MSEVIAFRRECDTPGEAQEYMLQMLRQYPMHTHDTRVTAVPIANSDGLKFLIVGTRREFP